MINIIIIVFLMIAAIVLIIAEIFLLPGITVAGIGGALFAIGGIVFAYSIGMTTGNITLISSIIVFGAIFFWLMRTNSFKRVALNTNIESKVSSPRNADLHIGDEGTAISRLAPIGKARFHNITVEAKSLNGFIEENTPVIITQIEGYNVTVENKNNINI